MTSPTRKILLSLSAVIALVGLSAALAPAKMRSERLGNRLCETTGGGRIVGIPGFPGERIDRRLKRDIALLERKYKIYVTDGFSTDRVHSANGEHPLGLALDIVPDASRGGRWRDIGRLARWAEPKQNQPRAPFRWVGYNGDAGHGRGHHLHLSWGHVGRTRFGKPVRTVFSMLCPGAGNGPSAPAPDKPAEPKPESDGGGVDPRKGGDSGGRNKKGGKKKGKQQTGGIGYDRVLRRIGSAEARRKSRESGGISLR